MFREQDVGGGVLGALGVRSFLPEGFEAPDVAHWLAEHPRTVALAQPLAAWAIGAMLKRYLARQARLKLEEARRAEADNFAALLVAGQERRRALDAAAESGPLMLETLRTNRLSDLAPAAFGSGDTPLSRRESLQNLLFDPHDDVPKIYYGR